MAIKLAIEAVPQRAGYRDQRSYTVPMAKTTGDARAMAIAALERELASIDPLILHPANSSGRPGVGAAEVEAGVLVGDVVAASDADVGSAPNAGIETQATKQKTKKPIPPRNSRETFIRRGAPVLKN